MDLDRTDLALVDALQRDASQRLEDLARVVQMAPSSVYERLRRLEERGVIQRWTIDLDAEAVGLGVLAFVGIRASKPCSAILPAVEAIPAVEECHSVAGELSLLLKVRVSSTVALVELAERLRRVPGIEGTETTIVLKTHFDRPMALPKPAAPKVVRSRSRTS
jgi:Lrp/AsnC family transcriptional regulator, leucine-responsive regulatory protein